MLLLLVAYGFDHFLQQYSENPTNVNLLPTVFMILPFWAGVSMLAYFLVRKVEFFENHLVTRSTWGFSRKRSYQDITSVAGDYDHLFVTFNGRDKIALHQEEIKPDDLVRWLAERDVSAVRDMAPAWDVRRESQGSSEDGRPERQALEPATLQNRAASVPVLTLRAPLWARIVGGGFSGGMLLLTVNAAYVIADKYFETRDTEWLFFLALMIVGICIWIPCLAYSLIPKVELHEGHVLIRSMWGRSRRLSYQEITQVGVLDDDLVITFNYVESITILRTTIDEEDFARWLADRSVTVERALKVEPQREESLADESKILRLR